MTKYQNPTNTRRESRTIAGRFRGGKLAPVMAQLFRESESGILSQTVTFELDPIAGRMITPIMGEVVSVYVPAQAMDALKNPDEAYAGNTEIVRDKLLSGSPLFDLETETELSKRLGIVPRSIAGVKKVNEVGRLAHNCAVNFLRQRKYVKAVQLLADNSGMTPALIGQTVLDRLNGVLDPEDRVEGAVNLELGSIKIPVKGIGLSNRTSPATHGGVTETDEDASRSMYGYVTTKASVESGSASIVVEQDTDNYGYPAIYADLDGFDTGNVSLSDFYNAERMDGLVRQMRELVDANPEYGEEIVQRWAHGLSVDTGKQPFILHQSSVQFGSEYRRATDGPNLDQAQTDMATQLSFTVPVPSTELGGVVITFAVLKPDETLASQPHPFLSEEWGAINYVSEEMARDPVPVTIRELDSECDQSDEGTVVLYTGHNHLKKSYVNYGFNRHIDLTTVENKTALWQLEVPMSVTPSSVIYPETLEHYPFADQDAEVCTYTISNVATIRTPLVFGPSPVEELATIETANLFEESE